jgi:hypothetical protein
MKTYGGFVKKGYQKTNFEITAANRDKVYKQLKSQFPGWEIKITTTRKANRRNKE